MTSWSNVSRATIARVAATLPDDMPFKDRKAAIDAAYPFGPRSHWPYKAWCKARRAYLERHGLKPLCAAQPTLLDLMPRDPETGRPMIV
jgi:hypothetical protein